MDIRNFKVSHKLYGLGIVTEQDASSIMVSFNIGIKPFQFPEAFDGYLTISDTDIAKEINRLIADKKTARDRENHELENRREEALHPKMKVQNHHTNSSPRYNIAFKCNFCDGGKSKEHIGFQGVCSDALIRSNIHVEHRTWCESHECQCSQYMSGEMSRYELDSKCKNGGFVCYESQMLRDWKAFAGIVQSGLEKGKPMKLKNVQTNSLCILTTRDPSTSEEDRYIFAVFLVDESYEGDTREEGYVSANSKYRIELSPLQAHQMLFWNYHANNSQPKVAAWGYGLHRYFDDDQAAIILKDILKLKSGTYGEGLANELYQKFIEDCGIYSNTLGEKKGALVR